MRTCEKCRDPESWCNCESVTLPGGIKATLCNPCQRAFTMRALASELNDRSALLAARRDHYRDLALAGQPVTEIARIELQRDLDAFAVELAELSMAWLSTQGELKPEVTLQVAR